jgi:hypothetical protein
LTVYDVEYWEYAFFLIMWDGIVGIATGYGLDDPEGLEFESQ